MSECVHDSVSKALMVLGLGRSRVTAVKTDAQGRMSVDGLPPLDGRTLICTQAGHVHTGAFDPIGDITDRAAAVGAWVHVDGAFGLWARAVPALAHLTAGSERADSWAVDMHKWLNVPYDSGMVLTRHDHPIRKAMAAWSPLLQDERQPAAYTLEQSRRARGVDLWASLAFLGREGLARMIEETCALAAGLADACSQAGLEVANEVVLNQVLVSAGDDEQTEALLRAVNTEGVIACSGARWKGRSYLRLSVSCHETTAADIEAAVQALCRGRAER